MSRSWLTNIFLHLIVYLLSTHYLALALLKNAYKISCNTTAAKNYSQSSSSRLQIAICHFEEISLFAWILSWRRCILNYIAVFIMTIIVITQKVCMFYKCVFFFLRMTFHAYHLTSIIYNVFCTFMLANTLYTFWESWSSSSSCHNVMFIILIIIIVTFYSLLWNITLRTYYPFTNKQSYRQYLKYYSIKE